jgi:hypothetical protein
MKIFWLTVNHSKLHKLHERIERIRYPVQQKLNEEKETNEELC